MANHDFASVAEMYRRRPLGRGGYFCPLSFTIRTSHRICQVPKHPDQEWIQGYANFVHEVTHYIGFTGTVFGLQYNLVRAAQQMLCQDILAAEHRPRIGLPLIANAPTLGEWGRLRTAPGDNLCGVASLLACEMYVSQEVAGSRQYREMIVAGSSSHEMPDPLMPIERGAGPRAPIRGLTVLENWAISSEALFLQCYSTEPTPLKGLEAARSDPDYGLILLVLSGMRPPRDYLMPHVAFAALNHRLNKNIEDALNRYALASRTAQLVTALLDWRDAPGQEDAILRPESVIRALCSRAGLEDPFDNVVEALEFLGSPQGTAMLDFPEVWLCQQVLTGFHEKPHTFFFWPAKATILQSTLNATPVAPPVPIWNVIFEDAARHERWVWNAVGFPEKAFVRLERAAHRRLIVHDFTFGISCSDVPDPVPGVRCPFVLTRAACPDERERECSAMFRFDLGQLPPSSCQFGEMLSEDWGGVLTKLDGAVP